MHRVGLRTGSLRADHTEVSSDLMAVLIANGPLDLVGRGRVVVGPRLSRRPELVILVALAFDPDRRVFWSRLALVEMVLRSQEMPEDELRVVLTSGDGKLVRRHLELHLERLEERLVAQRRSVKEVEQILTGATGQRLPASRSDDRRTVA